MSDLGTQHRQHLIGKLRDESFVLFFQSIVSASPGLHPPFREILLRYKEEEQGLLPPGSFLPLFEEEGLLHALDRWVIGRLLRYGQEIQAAGKRLPPCSVNLSIQTVLNDPGFGDYVQRGMQKLGVTPSTIIFEIMASEALAHPEAVASTHKQGVIVGVFCDRQEAFEGVFKR